MGSMSAALGLSGFEIGKKARNVARAAAATAMALVVAGCGAKAPEKASSTAPEIATKPVEKPAGELGRTVAVEPVGGKALIAVLAPIGAANPGVGKVANSIAKAAQLAARDIGDPSVVVRVYDTAGTPEGAAAAAEKAVAEGAALIVGPLFSTSVSAAGPVAAKGGLPVLAFTTDANVAGGNIFLGGILLETEIDRVVAYAASKGIRKIGALAPATKQGEVMLAALGVSAARYGVELVATERYERNFSGIEAGVRSYASTHKAFSKTAKVDGVFIAESGQALQSVGAYLAYFDVSPTKTKFLGAGIWNSASTLKEVALRGGWFAAPEPAPRAAFSERYVAAYGERPHALAPLGYDAVAAAGAMLAEARGKSERYPFTVEAITAPSGFAGVNGVYRFRKDGLNDRGLAILEVAEGEFKVLAPAPKTFSGY
ncbi:MAG: penicillin-binding protein activator [Neomegalonema sp.]|nr:penicillin-binding protein activator [Neomegalonema sp.]